MKLTTRNVMTCLYNDKTVRSMSTSRLSFNKKLHYYNEKKVVKGYFIGKENTGNKRTSERSEQSSLKQLGRISVGFVNYFNDFLVQVQVRLKC